MKEQTQIKEFHPLQAQITLAIAPTMKLVATDLASAQEIQKAAGVIKELQKRLDAKRDELVRPLNTKVKEINALAKDVGSPLLQAEAHLRTQLNQFAARQEAIKQAELKRQAEERAEAARLLREQQEAERKALEEKAKAAAQDDDVFGPGPEIEAKAVELEEKHAVEKAILKGEYVAKTYDAKATQVKGLVKTLRVKVENLDLVPKSYLIIKLNEAMAIAAKKAGQEIPGLSFFEEASVRIQRASTTKNQSLIG